MRSWSLAALVAAVAVVRSLYVLSIGMLFYATLFLAIAACLQYVGVFEVPIFGVYLASIPIEASITLLGILLAISGAMTAWRLQKRDELLLASVAEIQSFFEVAADAACRLNAYLLLLKDLQVELRAGPYSLQSYWLAAHLDEQAIEMRSHQAVIRRLAADVYPLGARNIHAMTLSPITFRSFSKAENYLLGLSNRLNFLLPKSRSGSVDEFIDRLRLTPEDAFSRFISDFDDFNSGMGEAVGAVRGYVQGRFFPATLTSAWVTLRSNYDQKGPAQPR